MARHSMWWSLLGGQSGLTSVVVSESQKREASKSEHQPVHKYFFQVSAPVTFAIITLLNHKSAFVTKSRDIVGDHSKSEYKEL